MPTTIELVEVAPNRWRVLKDTPQNFARSNHPRPYVISDIMEPTEQVDGKFYTSKSAFRRVGRQLGLVEVGTEKQINKVVRASSTRQAAESRRASIKKAIEKTKAGVRTNSP
jgi:hypothetical protein